MKIYYAHHQFKYGTKVEDYELNIIKVYHTSSDEIINPSEVINKHVTEANIMRQCVILVMDCDELIFSSMDGVIGIGVYTEVMTALALGKPVYYIYQDHLTDKFQIKPNRYSVSDRTFAIVETNIGGSNT